MDREIALVLLRNFLGRLVENGNGFRLPEGRLSLDEVNAFRVLSGLELITLERENSEPPASPDNIGDFQLDLSSTQSKGPTEKDLRLCLDFGTAMSKAWATGTGIDNTVPLVLGRYANLGDTLAVPSSVFISNSGKIFIGGSAEKQHRQEHNGARKRFDNLKRMLSDAEIDQDLNHVELPPGVDPSESGLTKGDLLVLYLAWLTDISLEALSDMADLDALDIDVSSVNIRAVKRRFAIPCFAQAIDESIGGPGRADWAEDVLRSAVSRAQIVADTLHGEWEDLSVDRARSVLGEVNKIDTNNLPDVLANSPSVREPIAAGASLFGQELGRMYDEVIGGLRRTYLIVIDAGAGTTDFAVFQAFGSDDDEYRYALIKPSVRMSRIAGNAVDEALQPLVLKACGIDPATGSPRSDEDFALIKTDLSSQIRNIKEILFRDGQVGVSLVPNAKGKMSLEDLLNDSQYQNYGGELVVACKSILEKIFHEKDLEVFRRRGQKFPIHVLLTGGSSALPIVRTLGNCDLTVSGTTISLRSLEGIPDWINTLPRELADLVAAAYPQIAVAIGGSAPEMPIELNDLQEPVTPPSRGTRTAGRFQVTGV
jgi:hypothetical protein